jgi:hypothetical protein
MESRTLMTVETEPKQQPASPEQIRQDFEQAWRPCLLGERRRRNEDGSETAISMYEIIFEPMNQPERRGVMASFVLNALDAGYTEAMAPVVIPNVGFKDQHGRQPLAAVYFFIEKPLSTGSPRGPTPSSGAF